MAKDKEEKEEKKKKKDKKGKQGEENLEEDDDEEEGGGILMFLVAIIIVAIWLAIIALLIKMDVGGFGSTVLAPILKDVPYVNMILPGNEEAVYVEEDAAYRYDTVAEAVERIKELEVEISELKASQDTNLAYVTELEGQADKLADYKAKEAEFENLKKNFYEEVVYSDEAPDIEEYKKYYESIDPENAEILYKQVIAQLEEDEEIEAFAKTYANMKPKAAATVFDTMTDDLRLVAKILLAMDSESRADILNNMSSDTAALVTKIMEP